MKKFNIFMAIALLAGMVSVAPATHAAVSSADSSVATQDIREFPPVLDPGSPGPFRVVDGPVTNEPWRVYHVDDTRTRRVERIPYYYNPHDGMLHRLDPIPTT